MKKERVRATVLWGLSALSLIAACVLSVQLVGAYLILLGIVLSQEEVGFRMRQTPRIMSANERLVFLVVGLMLVALLLPSVSIR